MNRRELEKKEKGSKKKFLGFFQFWAKKWRRRVEAFLGFVIQLCLRGGKGKEGEREREKREGREGKEGRVGGDNWI